MLESQVDLVIRNGLIVDGRGGAPFLGHVAVNNGHIIKVGDVGNLRGREEFDATGHIVTPGFVDVHTHYDGQAVWSSHLSPSSLHGVTTVVMGNCGVGFAPCRAADHAALVNVMEGVEDIPEIVMTAGLTWNWETFPEFLDALDRRPRDIDVAAYFPHSPLRVYVMGERAVRREPATPADMARMAELTREAIDCGAIGFASSSIPHHRTASGEFIPSYGAAEPELMAIAQAVKQSGRGMIQIVIPIEAGSLEEHVGFLGRLSQISGRSVTYSFAHWPNNPKRWSELLPLLVQENGKPGVKIKTQILPRPVGIIMGHELSLSPFRLCRTYQEMADLSLEERVKRLRDPAVKARILSETPDDPAQPIHRAIRLFDQMYLLDDPPSYAPAPGSDVASLARAKGMSPEEYAYDLLLENDGRNVMFVTAHNLINGKLDLVYETLNYEDAILGLGDGGAHYGLICDATYTTHFLSYWTRDRDEEKIPLPRAIQMLSHDTARLVGLDDRGVLAPGFKADINVIDYDRLTLRRPSVVRDLPSGGRRIKQDADGYAFTFVSGELIARDGEFTGNLPGRLVRGQQPAPAH